MDNQEEKESSDLFQLYDLKVEVLSGEKPMVCDHQQGEHFFVIGENIIFSDSTIVSEITENEKHKNQQVSYTFLGPSRTWGIRRTKKRKGYNQNDKG